MTSRKPALDGDSTMTANVPGALGDYLTGAGLRVLITVERADGAPLTATDREGVAIALDAAVERDQVAESIAPLRDRIALRRFGLKPAKAATRRAANKTATKPKGKQAAAKRPVR